MLRNRTPRPNYHAYGSYRVLLTIKLDESGANSVKGSVLYVRVKISHDFVIAEAGEIAWISVFQKALAVIETSQVDFYSQRSHRSQALKYGLKLQERNHAHNLPKPRMRQCQKTTKSCLGDAAVSKLFRVERDVKDFLRNLNTSMKETSVKCHCDWVRNNGVCFTMFE